MPENLYYFTEDDVAILRSVIDTVRRAPDRMGGRRPTIPPTIDRSPEVYVIRTPVGGIPALTPEAGAGIVDTPGTAACSVYQIQDAGAGTFKLYPAATGTFTIYNLSAVPIPGSTWTTAKRDKFGRWVATLDGEGALLNLTSGCGFRWNASGGYYEIDVSTLAGEASVTALVTVAGAGGTGTGSATDCDSLGVDLTTATTTAETLDRITGLAVVGTAIRLSYYRYTFTNHFNAAGLLIDRVAGNPPIVADYIDVDPCTLCAGTGTGGIPPTTGTGTGDDGIQTTCCPDNLIGTVLTMTTSGGCATTTTLTWNGTAWVGSNTFGVCSAGIVLTCSGTTWTMSGTGGLAGWSQNMTQDSCNPILLSSVSGERAYWDPCCIMPVGIVVTV